MTNIFEGLNLVNSAPEELWVVMHAGGREQSHWKEKGKQKGKVVNWEGFTNSWRKEEKWKARENLHVGTSIMNYLLICYIRIIWENTGNRKIIKNKYFELF